ncbi:phenylacetic acid degradation bifunctional protein PaaZ [uncultured Lentibacter sp.]|uniref:phenylacetic acid degradation bifunctional protein PaaZ n=1 Tax=uncultured Lentibacter sp. TaxID=1659309 RepID=UPI00260250D8|nr:phenylacetic acid degradation bifunctional protein PaaZ [uncultured Lentibacter sp.]
MTLQNVQSFAAGTWISAAESARPIFNAVTGAKMAVAGCNTLPVQDMLDYAKDKGGTFLRAMTFHQRAKMLKAVALYLNERKQQLYDISFATGATLSDHMIDVDGGIGTMFVYASKGRREMPDSNIYLDGELEQLGRTGTFLGQHICTPLHGVGVHINAFNFPVWGMLEKLAPTLLAGVPAIVKPASSTAYVTELAVKIMLESGLLPEGALQLISGGVGDLFDGLGPQDVVSFTGSAATALKLRSHPSIAENSTRFIAEQDSLNASVLGPDAAEGTEEFDLFIKEVIREMTAKAGQKCTAIRRIMVPETQVSAVTEALAAKLESLTIGDPRDEATRMGALVSAGQKRDVLAMVDKLASESQIIWRDEARVPAKGAFVSPVLLHCEAPDSAVEVHATEAFGPVSTVMGYRDMAHAAALVAKGQGSLVTSLITADPGVASAFVAEAAPWNGRIYINNRHSMQESTGHGSPLPHMVHGGPGRAGGGEEMGGIRGVMHYMQRTAIQGSPDMLTSIGNKWVPGADQITGPAHPFTRRFSELVLGETLHTASRTITLEDIEHFAHFTGDTFYAHMDEAAAARNPFFPGRVAHGYLLLSFAAGLFVEPNEGPVLANTGLDNLRFMKPVVAGDAIKVALTVKRKTTRNEDYGEVRWHVALTNQDDALCATYELLTMNAL